jgi:hypothetical protein
MTDRAAEYRSMAFARYQAPFGADQSKIMSAWPLRAVRVKQPSSVERYFGDDPVTSWRKDMWSVHAGSEGLQYAELFPNPAPPPPGAADSAGAARPPVAPALDMKGADNG